MTEGAKNKLLTFTVAALTVLLVVLMFLMPTARWDDLPDPEPIVRTDTVWRDTTIYVTVPSGPIEIRPVPDKPAHGPDTVENICNQRVQKHYSDSVNSVKYDIFVSGIQPDLDSCSFSCPEKVITKTVTQEKLVERKAPFRGLAIGPAVQLDYGQGPGAIAAVAISWQSDRHRVSLEAGERFEFRCSEASFKPYIGFRYTYDLVRFPSRNR